MVIHKDELEHCWPSCVVLMSLISFSHVAIDGDFSIMATSNIVELPVKEKVDLLVRKKEQKSLIIDLNYALEKEEDIINYIRQYFYLLSDCMANNNLPVIKQFTK